MNTDAEIAPLKILCRNSPALPYDGWTLVSRGHTGIAGVRAHTIDHIELHACIQALNLDSYYMPSELIHACSFSCTFIFLLHSCLSSTLEEMHFVSI